MLTDPAIHTVDRKVLPDTCNLGQPGMAAFFATHQCTRFCRELGLEIPGDGRAMEFRGGIGCKVGIADTEYVMDGDRDDLIAR
jgi:hypothetical protein